MDGFEAESDKYTSHGTGELNRRGQTMIMSDEGSTAIDILVNSGRNGECATNVHLMAGPLYFTFHHFLFLYHALRILSVPHLALP